MDSAELKAIAGRDDSWNDGTPWRGAMMYAQRTPVLDGQSTMVADRRALRILVDQLLERELEARELLEAVLITDHEWVDRRTAWLAAPSPVSPPKGPVTP
jgi:hypothetical protein